MPTTLGLHGRVDVLLRVVLLRGLLSNRPRILDLADDQPAALRFLQSRRFFLALRCSNKIVSFLKEIWLFKF